MRGCEGVQTAPATGTAFLVEPSLSLVLSLTLRLTPSLTHTLAHTLSLTRGATGTTCQVEP